MAALILTIVINISAPVANQKSLSFTTLSLTTGNNAWFGVFGYCWEVDSVYVFHINMAATWTTQYTDPISHLQLSMHQGQDRL